MRVWNGFKPFYYAIFSVFTGFLHETIVFIFPLEFQSVFWCFYEKVFFKIALYLLNTIQKAIGYKP